MSAETLTVNGLPAVKLASAGSSALVYVTGAHVASWTCDGEERLFVSSKSDYGGGNAIRGGIPLCWPQFAAKGQYQKHGFCRNSAEWTVVRTSTEPFPCVVLGLVDTEATRALWPFPFTLRYSVTLDGTDSLSTALTVINTGAEAVEFTGALHTYFAADVTTAVVRGLAGASYDDSVAGTTGLQSTDDQLAFSGEVDRIYYSTAKTLYVCDGAKAVKVLKMGMPDAVVWNIGGEKAGTLKDLGDGEWSKYVCLEAAVIGKPVKLAPATSWTAGQTFTAITSAAAAEELKAAAEASAKAKAA